MHVCIFILLRVFIGSVYSLWAKNRVSFDRHNGVQKKYMNKGLPCIINLNVVGKNRRYLGVVSFYYMQISFMQKEAAHFCTPNKIPVKNK